MSIIDSSTTGHSRPQERKFSNRLFIGIIALVAVAMVVALIMGQKKELSPTVQGKPATQESKANSDAIPLAPADQPKN
ncbi:MAG: hypothetical protein H7061_10125 [Bdellovibrionaceae bacterium]|nr:hypothetical protein [Bdellovibrio sp.]